LAAAFKNEKNVLVAGVCRKGGMGCPETVLQPELKSRKEQIQVRVTVKAAVMEGNADCLNMVAVSVYDPKPVHFLSTSCQLIEWITKDRKLFLSSLGRIGKNKFLRLNINDNYNQEMDMSMCLIS
jgi:hypothetical protein